MSGKEPTCQCRGLKRRGFAPWVGQIPWRRAWQPTPVSLPEDSPWTEEPGGLQSVRSQRVRCTHRISHVHHVLVSGSLASSTLTSLCNRRHVRPRDAVTSPGRPPVRTGRCSPPLLQHRAPTFHSVSGRLAPRGASLTWICRVCPAVLGSFHRAQRPPGSSVLSGIRTPFLLTQVFLPAPSLADTEAVTP